MKDASLKSFFFLQLVSPNYKDWLVPYLREFFISQYKTGFSIKSSNNNYSSSEHPAATSLQERLSGSKPTYMVTWSLVSVVPKFNILKTVT